jgi:DNA modification methylase
MFNEAKIVVGDNRKTLASLPAGSVQTCITSPPYWGLRDYGQDDQIGLEDSPEAFVEQLCLVFDEVWRVLADDGTLWLNLGDSYAGNNSRASDNGRAGFGNEREGVFTKTGEGLKTKDLVGIPWRVAFALQARGWYLRSEIIWHKPNPMPESVTDRPTKSHEHIFLMSKSAKYFYDHEAIKEPVTESSLNRSKYAFHTDRPATKNAAIHMDEMGERFVDASGRNKRDVWSVPTQGFPGAHFAVYPPALIEPCVLAGSRAGDTVLDPFSGSGTTGMVALRNGRNYVGCELNPEYAALSKQRIGDDCGMFGDVTVHHDA